jgi:hypothetical protein
MKKLFEYEKPTKDFVLFLNNNGYDPVKILSGNIIDSLGYILKFLETQAIYILVDNYSLMMYTNGTTKKSIDYVKMTHSIYIIKQLELKKKTDVITNYEYAIVEAFKFLQIEF